MSGASYDHVHRVLSAEFEDLGPQTVKNLDTPVRACMAVMTEFAQPAGLEAIDIPVLAALMDEPAVGLRQLAGRVGIELAVAARSAARLEGKGLITRTPDADKARAWVFGMTPEGIGVRLRLRTALIVAQDRLMAPLSDREREMLKDLIWRVIKADDSRAPQRR